MSKKVEEIKKLQEELFVEEHGITKEQAEKLNKYMYHTPLGKEFDFWAGCEVPKPPLQVVLGRLEEKIKKQETEISAHKRENKKVNLLFWIYVMLSSVTLGIMSLH